MYQHVFKAPTTGVPARVSATGKYVRYMASVSSSVWARINIKTDAGESIELLPGQGIELSRRATHFEVANVDKVVEIVGTLLIGDGRIDDSRVQGEVTTTDGGYVKSLAGLAFSSALQVAAVAATYSHLGVHNNSGGANSYNLVVTDIHMAVLTGGPLLASVLWQAAPLTGATGGYNALAGGAAGYGQMQSATNGLVTGNLMRYMTLETLKMTSVKLPRPIVLRPGYGLAVAVLTQNIGMAGSFDWYLEAATP